MDTRNHFHIANSTPLRAVLALAVLFFAVQDGLCSLGVNKKPVIRFTKVPPPGGGPDRLETVAGIVTGIDIKDCDCRIVLYAETDRLYVQPFDNMPYTEISQDGSFEARIHLGSQYHALLVKRSYRPAATLRSLPGVEGDVIAIASVKARAEEEKSMHGMAFARTITFSGHKWKVKASGDQRVGPGPNFFSDGRENIWVDAEGKLHLRITHRDGVWQCAEVILTEDHSYGTYSFTLETPPRAIVLASTVVLGAFLWNDAEAAHNHCEIDFELSPWTRRNNKVAQFVIQPYTIPENIVRFDVPEILAPTTHLFTWRRDRVECESLKGIGVKQRAFYRHTFTQGIPPTTNGTNARINLWLFGGKAPVDGQEVEVVLSRFEFTPLS